MRHWTLLLVSIASTVALVTCSASEEYDPDSWRFSSNNAETNAESVSELVEETRRLLASLRRRKQPNSLALPSPRKRQGKMAVNKRHCWDVADVCCMWNIC